MNLLTDLTVSVYIKKKKPVLHMTRTQTRVAQLCQWVYLLQRLLLELAYKIRPVFRKLVAS